MTVEIISMQGGSPPTTSFADSFQRADQPFFVGDSWYPIIDQSTSGGFSGAQIAASINVSGGTQLLLGNTAALNTNALQMMFIPRPVYPPAIINHSQRATVKFNSRSGAAGTIDARAGLIVLANTNQTGVNGECYALTIAQAGPDVLTLRRGVIFTASVPAGWANIVVVPGDTFTLEAILGVASNTINVYLNGVLNQSIVDADASRPRAGMYGMCYVGFNNNQTLGFQNFSARVV